MAALIAFVEAIETPGHTGDVPVKLRGNASHFHIKGADALAESRQYVLDGLKRLEWPVYLDVATDVPATITDLKIPKPARVLDIEPDATPGWHHVRLDRSSARHTVNANTAAGVHVLQLLELSRATSTFVAVVDDPETHEILDVHDTGIGGRFQRFSKSIKTFDSSVTVATPPDVLERLPVTAEADVARLFNTAVADACGRQPQTSCNPFKYPDDGCWARAQRMCENIEGGGFRLNVAKVWIYGQLTAETPDHPACRVTWDWHVAPIISVGSGRYRVIDPTLEPGRPLMYDEWRGRIAGIQHVRFTESWVYKMAQPDELRGEIVRSESDDQIEIYRLMLIDRIGRLKKLPPYCR
jgi:hypothetical protein